MSDSLQPPKEGRRPAARRAERAPVVFRQTPCKRARLRLVRQRDAAAPCAGVTRL